MRYFSIMTNPEKPETLLLAERVRAALAASGMETVEELEAGEALIVAGGDGTILVGARRALEYRKPVLGINAGRLGFLAALEPHELHLLPRLARDDYCLDRRMLLRASIWQGERLLRSELCVNDAVIARQDLPRAAEIPVKCGSHMLCYLGDGVIFSTPTGSTAYSLSAGGPVLDPRVEGIVLTPICNHRLFSRAIVCSPEERFSVEITQNGLALTCDAEAPVPLYTGQRVTVERGEEMACFIRLKPDNFLDVLNGKLVRQ
ncbi:MAG: NAD(+)/NADH kinase [Oscillospiraceae bacterium]|nr:NAD(+)/NADH kinase [Oscillospiraceae bacterium]